MDALSLNDVDPQYSGLLNLYDSLYMSRWNLVALARDYFIEIAYRGVEIIKFANKASKFIRTGSIEDLEKFKKSISGHFKNYDANTDALLFDALLQKYHIDQADSEYLPAYFLMVKFMLPLKCFLNHILPIKKLEDLFNSSLKRFKKKLSNDPAFKVSSALYGHYRDVIYSKYWALEDELDALDRLYIKAMMEVLQIIEIIIRMLTAHCV